jgi:hypothetical protein
MSMLKVPNALKSGHEALYAGLRRAMREPGATGECARNLMQIMDGHMMREEKFALRPLGLLKALSRGETPADLAEAIAIVEGFKREMPQMMDEHRQIADLLRRFAKEAEAAGKPEYVQLAEDLVVHAQIEEDVLYPTAILVGAYAALVRKG